MKGFLKYVFFLMLLCSYTAASFEVNEKECKQNYGKETHEYILSQKTTNNISSVEVKKPVDIKGFYVLITFAHHLFSEPNLYKHNYANKFYSPPRLNKIYLYNSVFLI